LIWINDLVDFPTSKSEEPFSLKRLPLSLQALEKYSPLVKLPNREENWPTFQSYFEAGRRRCRGRAQAETRTRNTLNRRKGGKAIKEQELEAAIVRRKRGRPPKNKDGEGASPDGSC
jgi:hypothetical protein